MKILRVERKNNPKAGPWNDRSTSSFEDMLARIAGIKRPIDRAEEVAERHHVKKPSAMPAPTRDDALMRASEMYGRPMYDDEWYFGFKDVDQYKDWFRTPAVREALMGDDAVLACYEVPDRSALVGDHQVVFRMDDAIHKEILPKSYAVHLF